MLNKLTKYYGVTTAAGCRWRGNYAKAACVAAVLSVIASCSSGDNEASERRLLDCAGISEILRPGSLRANIYDEHLDSMPDGGVRMKINYLGGYLAKVFNDSNYVHLEAARRIGIVPINCISDAWNIRRPIVKIESCENYYVDELTHSMPFLVPEAARLLDDIGRNFRDSLAARGGGAYRVKVTSVLRTPATVRALRRRNGNAVEESTHLYGTTFDISYSQFICDNDSLARTQEDLKNLLGEVMNDLRTRGRCYVKYERKQACFHITACNSDSV